MPDVCCSRVLTYAERLLEALEDLDAAGGVRRMSPGQASRLLPLLADLRGEIEAARAGLERTHRRPARGLSPARRSVRNGLDQGGQE